MPGSFYKGEVKTRPGSYYRTENLSNRTAQVPTDIVAALFSANWGALETPTLITSLSQKSTLFGNAGNTEIIDLLLEQGARVLAVRLGDTATGTMGTYTVKDTTGAPVSVVTLTAKYKGDRDLRFTIRDSLFDASKRELLVFDVTTLLETISFTKGAGGSGEPALLVDAVTASSNWVTAAKLDDGNKILAAVSGVALTVAGTNPTIATAQYTSGAASLQGETFSFVVIDSQIAAEHAVVDAFVNSMETYGNPVIGVIGEPTTVALATRQANAAAFNDHKIWYVGNGGIDSDLVEYEGWKAAAIVAGITAYRGAGKSNTHAVIDKFTSIKGTLSGDQIDTCIGNGMTVFTKNNNSQVQIDYGITTLVVLPTDLDAGWKKQRRTYTRFELITRAKAATDLMIGQVNNDSSGQKLLMGQIYGVMGEMVNEGKLKDGGDVVLDPDYPADGDYVSFLIGVVDVDSAEKIYMTFQFQF